MLAALPAKPAARYIGLVLNRRGFERAQAAGCAEVGHGHRGQRKLQPAQPGLQRRRGHRRLAGDRQRRARGRHPRADHDIDRLRLSVRRRSAGGACVAIAERLAAGEPDEIAVADTIGVAVPTQVTELIGALRRALPQRAIARAFPQHPQHRTRQRLRRGPGRRAALDASCGGIGGCPFAPAATGNIPTEDLIYMLHRMGSTPAWICRRCSKPAAGCRQTLDHAVPGMVVKAGLFPASQHRWRTRESEFRCACGAVVALSLALAGCGKQPDRRGRGKERSKRREGGTQGGRRRQCDGLDAATHRCCWP